MEKVPKTSTFRYLPWLICLIGTLYYFFETILEVIPNTLVKQLIFSFQIKGSTVGILDTAYFMTYALMQLPGGALLDRFGARRVLTIAGLLTCIGLIVFASTVDFTTAITSRFITGLGGSFGLMGAMFLITRWLPQQKRAFYLGTAIMIGLSGGLFQSPLAHLVNHYGWRSIMLLLGTIGGGFALLFWLIVHTAALPTNNQTIWLTLGRQCKKILGNRQNWSIAIFGGLMYVPTGTIGSLWGITFLSAYFPHTPEYLLADINGLIFLGWICGSPLAGWFSDRWQLRQPFLIFGAIILLSCLLSITYITRLPLSMMCFSFFCIGLASSCSSLTFVMASETNPEYTAGTAIGFVNMLAIVPSVVLSPLFGTILDYYWQGNIVDGTRHYTLNAFQHAMILEYAVVGIALVMAIWWIKETYGA